MVALRLDKSEEEIAAMAGATFFPQPNEKNETCYDHGDGVRTAAPNDTPFTLAELQASLDVANVRSAPGRDCKTEFVVVLSGSQRDAEKTRNLYTLNLAGKPSKRSSTVRVLGLFIDQDGKAGTWMARVKKEGRQILHLFRRSLFSSRIFYGYNYHHVTTKKRYES
ncbi:unnamed protein product [Ixodes pacificus]